MGLRITRRCVFGLHNLFNNVYNLRFTYRVLELNVCYAFGTLSVDCYPVLLTVSEMLISNVHRFVVIVSSGKVTALVAYANAYPGFTQCCRINSWLNIRVLSRDRIPRATSGVVSQHAM